MCLCSHAFWRPNGHVVLWGLEHLYLPGAVLGPLVQQRQSIPACPWTCPHSQYSRPAWPGLREATAGSQKDWPGKEGQSLTEERSEPTELSLKVRLHPLLSGKVAWGSLPCTVLLVNAKQEWGGFCWLFPTETSLGIGAGWPTGADGLITDSGSWRGWRLEEEEHEDKSQDRTSLTGSWHDHLPPQIERWRLQHDERCTRVARWRLQHDERCTRVVRSHTWKHPYHPCPVLLAQARHRPWPHSRSQTPGMRVMGSPDESVCHSSGGQPVGLLSPKISLSLRAVCLGSHVFPGQSCPGKRHPDSTVWPVGRDLAPGKTILLFPGFWHWDLQTAS